MAMTRIEQSELLRHEKELNKLLRHMGLVIGPLDADYYLAGKYWREDKKNEQFWSRVVIRCLFADIEARLFHLRKAALKMGEVRKVAFTNDEMEILTEIKANGKPKFLPLKDSVKESFKLFAKSVGATFVVNFGTPSGKALLGTIEVRNGLMHPKETFDLGITTRQIEAAEMAIEWLNKLHNDLFDHCRAEIAAHTASLLAARYQGK
jgi:hypothetical protein